MLSQGMFAFASQAPIESAGLLQARLFRRLSQKELGARADLSQAYCSFIENDAYTSVSEDAFLRLEDALNLGRRSLGPGPKDVCCSWLDLQGVRNQKDRKAYSAKLILIYRALAELIGPRITGGYGESELKQQLAGKAVADRDVIQLLENLGQFVVFVNDTPSRLYGGSVKSKTHPSILFLPRTLSHEHIRFCVARAVFAFGTDWNSSNYRTLARKLLLEGYSINTEPMGELEDFIVMQHKTGIPVEHILKELVEIGSITKRRSGSIFKELKQRGFLNRSTPEPTTPIVCQSIASALQQLRQELGDFGQMTSKLGLNPEIWQEIFDCNAIFYETTPQAYLKLN